MAVPTDHLRTVLSSTWALGVLVFVADLGRGRRAPVRPSLDVSSHAGLNMAASAGLGPRPRRSSSPIGPLGFLKSYLVFYEWPARLATLYGLALHLALSISLVWAARRNFPLVVAVAVALVAAALLRGDLGGGRGPRRRRGRRARVHLVRRRARVRRAAVGPRAGRLGRRPVRRDRAAREAQHGPRRRGAGRDHADRDRRDRLAHLAAFVGRASDRRHGAVVRRPARGSATSTTSSAAPGS